MDSSHNLRIFRIWKKSLYISYVFEEGSTGTFSYNWNLQSFNFKYAHISKGWNVFCAWNEINIWFDIRRPKNVVSLMLYICKFEFWLTVPIPLSLYIVYKWDIRLQSSSVLLFCEACSLTKRKTIIQEKKMLYYYLKRVFFTMLLSAIFPSISTANRSFLSDKI
jgi:hypothetical protein